MLRPCPTVPGVASPATARRQSEALPRSASVTEIQERVAGQASVHAVLRDQELSGIESCTSIVSKTVAIAYRASIGSTKPHARIALETSALSSAFGNASNPATDSSSSCRTSSNRATRLSAMRTFKSEQGSLNSGFAHPCTVEGYRNSLFVLSIGSSFQRSDECNGDRVSVLVVFANQPGPTIEQMLPGGLADFCQGPVAAFAILRARHNP